MTSLDNNTIILSKINASELNEDFLYTMLSLIFGEENLVELQAITSAGTCEVVTKISASAALSKLNGNSHWQETHVHSEIKRCWRSKRGDERGAIERQVLQGQLREKELQRKCDELSHKLEVIETKHNCATMELKHQHETSVKNLQSELAIATTNLGIQTARSKILERDCEIERQRNSSAAQTSISEMQKIQASLQRISAHAEAQLTKDNYNAAALVAKLGDFETRFDQTLKLRTEQQNISVRNESIKALEPLVNGLNQLAAESRDTRQMTVNCVVAFEGKISQSHSQLMSEAKATSEKLEQLRFQVVNMGAPGTCEKARSHEKPSKSSLDDDVCKAKGGDTKLASDLKHLPTATPSTSSSTLDHPPAHGAPGNMGHSAPPTSEAAMDIVD